MPEDEAEYACAQKSSGETARQTRAAEQTIERTRGINRLGSARQNLFFAPIGRRPAAQAEWTAACGEAKTARDPRICIIGP
jgi:hypothetical protein